MKRHHTLIVLLGIYPLGLAAQSVPIYSYVVPAGGYAPNGNLVQMQDSVNGNWSYGYDSLNRVTGAAVTPTTGPVQNLCWSYDSFGNRTNQLISTGSITTNGAGGCSTANSNAYSTNPITYDANNHVTGTALLSPLPADYYDAAGNVQNDGTHQYVYDEEGRLCAVGGASVAGGGTFFGTQYIYDAEGRRVAKGTISTPICDRTANGFQLTSTYILDQAGRQVSELDGTGAWRHTNVYLGGTLLATYDPVGLHFNVTDPLGTKRMQAASTGEIESTCTSLPFGDGPPCTAGQATEQRYTGKEKDAESGLDYFGARYYASNMGRFMTPDPSGLLYADRSNPQSLNLYAYALNNPLKNTDPTGLYCYYGDSNSTSDGFDNSQYDFHSSIGECEQTDENGNKGQFINDAYTHDGVDDNNRPGEAFSSNTETTQPSGFPMNQPIGYAFLNSLPRYSLQFNQQVQVGGTPPVVGRYPAIPYRKPPVKLTKSQIESLCAIAVLLQGGGTVPGGSSSGTASSTPQDDTPGSDLPIPGRRGPDLAYARSDPTSGQVANYAALASVGGNFVACVAAVGAAN